MAKKKENRVIIIERKKDGNNFGDLTLTVTVELRVDKTQAVIESKTFSTSECEGQHADAYRYMMTLINAYAKLNDAVWSGNV